MFVSSVYRESNHRVANVHKPAQSHVDLPLKRRLNITLALRSSLLPAGASTLCQLGVSLILTATMQTAHSGVE